MFLNLLTIYCLRVKKSIQPGFKKVIFYVIIKNNYFTIFIPMGDIIRYFEFHKIYTRLYQKEIYFDFNSSKILLKFFFYIEFKYVYKTSYHFHFARMKLSSSIRSKSTNVIHLDLLQKLNIKT